MYSISQTCQFVGISRSTLLYYERIGLVSPKRNPISGYRDYSQDDAHTLVLIRQLKKAGFSLKEASSIVEGVLDAESILKQFYRLDSEIQELKVAHEIVRSLVVHSTGKPPSIESHPNPAGIWHSELEKVAGEAHAKWLKRLGFDDKEQLYIRWVTRNLSNSEAYMKDFFQVFEQMKRQGPGSRSSTIRAFNLIPSHQQVRSILEVGCGKGQSSLVLAEISHASITAVDNHQPFLNNLLADSARQGVDHRINVKNLDMLDMAFTPTSFDLIWSEGSAYFMGFQNALTAWKPLLRPDGHLFISDAVWLTEQPSPACTEYFQIEYPNMSTVTNRLREAQQLGYEIVNQFILPQQDWCDFYDDMEACTRRAIQQQGMATAFKKMINEVEIGRKHGHEYGYLCLLLRPNADNTKLVKRSM